MQQADSTTGLGISFTPPKQHHDRWQRYLKVQGGAFGNTNADVHDECKTSLAHRGKLGKVRHGRPIRGMS